MGSRSTFGAENPCKGEYAIFVTYGVAVEEKHVGCIIFGSKMNGIALSCLSQLLDCVPSCEGRSPPYSHWRLVSALSSTRRHLVRCQNGFVEPSEFNSNMKLDPIVEGQDNCFSSEDNIDDGSAYSASSEEEMMNNPPNTCKVVTVIAESGLMV